MTDKKNSSTGSSEAPSQRHYFQLDFASRAQLDQVRLALEAGREVVLHMERGQLFADVELPDERAYVERLSVRLTDRGEAQAKAGRNTAS